MAVVAILCAPLLAAAGDKTVLRPMLDFEQGWDSNVLNDSKGEESSLVTRVGPGLWIENTGELGHARLGLSAVGRSVWEDSELSGIDTSVRGDFDRALTPRLSIVGDGALDYYSGYEEIRDSSSGQPSGLPGEVILAEQPAWKRDHIGAGFRYLLTERLSFRMNGSAGRVNYERLDDVALTSRGEYRDRDLLFGQALLVYQLNALDQLTLGVDANDTGYQDLGTGTNESTIWTTKAGWTRNWSPVWTTEATLGISMLDSTQDDVPQSASYVFDPCSQFGFSCPQGGVVPLSDASFSDTGTNLVGSIAIKRVFARGLLRLSYDRATRSTGGSSRTNFDIDSFRLIWAHALAERVKLTLMGDYSINQSVSDKLPSRAALFDGLTPVCSAGGTPGLIDEPGFPFDLYQCTGGSAEEKQEYTGLMGRIDWQMRRRVNAYVVARYYTSTTDQEFGNGISIETEDLDKFTIGFGFRYAFDVGL